MKNLLAKIPTGLKQSLLTIVGNIATTGMSALSLILISRILGPEKFGEFSIGFSLVLIIAKISDFGLGATVLKFAGETTNLKTQQKIFSFTSSYKLITSILLLIVGIAFAPLISKIMRFERIDIIVASFLLSLATVYYEQILVTLQSLHRFSYAVTANGIQAGSKLIGALIFLLLNLKSSMSHFIWYAASPGFVFLFQKFLLPKKLKISLTTKIDTVTKPILVMAKHTSVSLIAGGIIENVDVFFTQRYLNTHETGVLGGVNKISMLFALVAYSLANVLNPRASRYKHKADLSKYLMKSGLVVIGSILLFFSFIPFSKISILLTIGQEYLDGTNILLILVAAQCLAIASIPFIALFYSFGATWYFSVSGVLQLLIVLIGNYILVPRYGLEGAAYTRLLTRLFLLVFSAGLGIIIYLKEYARPQKNST